MITSVGQNGIADAANSFLDAYVKARQLNSQDERDRQQGLLRELQMEESRANMKNQGIQTNLLSRKEGFLIDPTTGEISQDPAAIEKENEKNLFEYTQHGLIPKYSDDPQAPAQPKGLLQDQASIPASMDAQPNTGILPEGSPLPQKIDHSEGLLQPPTGDQVTQTPQTQTVTPPGQKPPHKLIGFERDPNDPMALWKQAQQIELLGRLRNQDATLNFNKDKLSIEAQKAADDLAIKREELAKKYGEKPETDKDKAMGEYYRAKAAEAIAASKKPAKGKTNVGQQSLDRTFAKDYDDWTSAGAALTDKNLQRLEDAKATLQGGKGGGLLGFSGTVASYAPDFMKSNAALRVRDDVRAAAQGALKATLGSQFTEKEGERIMNSAYNERMSPEENVRKIDMAIAELKAMKDAKNAKADFFESNNGTLEGYKAGIPQSSGGKGLLQETKVVNGVTYQKVGKKWKKQ